MQDQSPELTALRTRIAQLEEQVRNERQLRNPDATLTRRRLDEAADRIERLASRNEKLGHLLGEAREQLALLRAEVDRLTGPPASYGVVLGVAPDGSIDVDTNGRRLRVGSHPSPSRRGGRSDRAARLAQRETRPSAG